jgi:hypothetical protein
LNEVIWLALRKVDSWNEKATRSLSVPFESPPLGFPVEPSLGGFELGGSWKSGGLLVYGVTPSKSLSSRYLKCLV